MFIGLKRQHVCWTLWIFVAELELLQNLTTSSISRFKKSFRFFCTVLLYMKIKEGRIQAAFKSHYLSQTENHVKYELKSKFLQNINAYL